MGSVSNEPPRPTAHGEESGAGRGRKETPSFDLRAARERLGQERGRRFWRSLEELADGGELDERLGREFPSPPFDWDRDGASGVDRRRFLQLSGASLALAGLTGCTRQPPEKVVPYVRQPEEVVPGKPLYYATSTTLGGYARPLLAESHMGRPTKVEGNPDHPASHGASDVYAQASILDLYDLDRAQRILHYGKLRSWGRFVEDLQTTMRTVESLGGEGLRILTGAVSSPTLLAQLQALLERLPEARWHIWEAAAGTAAEGSRMAFGEALETVYRVSEADVVVSLDSDFLTTGPGAVSYARQFADRRRLEDDGARLNRFYAVESTPTATASRADHRLALRPSEVERFARALAAELGVAAAPAGDLTDPRQLRWVRAMAADLRDHRGTGLVVAGDYAPPAVHALAHAINEALGNVGTTVYYTDPVVAVPGEGSPAGTLEELYTDMMEHRVDSLLILGGNPVFDAPAELNLAAALARVDRRIYLGYHDNETAELCHWQIPESHALESWSDGRAYDGTVTLQQPVIETLFDTHTAHEILAVMNGRTDATAYDLIREHWQGEGLSEAQLRRAIHDGFVTGTALEPREVAGARVPEASGSGAAEGLELAFRPDPTIWDGRFANNGWLQECPKPLTKLTWDNALLISPATAERFGVANEDVVTLSVPAGEEGAPRQLDVPVWVLPGHPDGAATLHLGYGRRRVGRVGAGCGVDAYSLRGGEAPWYAAGVRLEPTGRQYPLASTQDHHAMEGRGQVRSATLETYRDDPEFAKHWGHSHAPGEEESFYPPYEYDGYAWGMAVDLNACTGCNACVVACQSENNIPVVGKSQVLNGREMHWIRIDRYYEGSLDDPTVHHQPVMCQHCEQAPCEVVCPVAATVHSDEGLNDMVYNRCVGTRYCSNNCPYKVRRFNFLKYNDLDVPLLKMLRNPDVTVRGRGVMEKCTYCVQRINTARQDAKVEGRSIEDGEIRTACQQACPSGAIVFGDVNDPESAVSRWKARSTDYGLLAELNTRPRTSYLAKVTNPNPALEEA